ncbi:hypothetical protein PCL_10402 [Purpureocillium lilacinum]|uniref:Uncharacterized protein n=1 Tax=Purpureocillium lilacinum TaxID=33203 RepID=A0A2U3EFT8_PURLI|nr:hypothetical protein PCL_10402 [Purpureocillium lilacinum]
MPVTIHRHHHRLGCGPSTFRKRTQPAQQGKDVRPSITPDASPSKTLKVLGEELSWETKNTAAGLGGVARRLSCAVAAQPPRAASPPAPPVSRNENLPFQALSTCVVPPPARPTKVELGLKGAYEDEECVLSSLRRLVQTPPVLGPPSLPILVEFFVEFVKMCPFRSLSQCHMQTRWAGRRMRDGCFRCSSPSYETDSLVPPDVGIRRAALANTVALNVIPILFLPASRSHQPPGTPPATQTRFPPRAAISGSRYLTHTLSLCACVAVAPGWLVLRESDDEPLPLPLLVPILPSKPGRSLLPSLAPPTTPSLLSSSPLSYSSSSSSSLSLDQSPLRSVLDTVICSSRVLLLAHTSCYCAWPSLHRRTRRPRTCTDKRLLAASASSQSPKTT